MTENRRNSGPFFAAATQPGSTEKPGASSHSEPRQWSQWDFIDAVGDGIYGVDLEGQCTFVNRAALGALGYASGEELVGGNMHDLIHHTRQDGSPYPQEDCPLLHTLTSGRSVRLENEMLWRKDGTSFIAEYSSFPIISGGVVTGSVITFSDVSFRREAQNRHAVQYAVSQVLAGSADLVNAPARILAAVGSGLGWDFGAFWIAECDTDEIPRLHCTADWRGAHATPVSELSHTNEVLRLGPGEGLPGRAWAEDGPVYMANLAMEWSLPRHDDAMKDGLRTGFAFPVKAGAETVGVIEFFSRRRISVDDSLKEAVRHWVSRSASLSSAAASRKNCGTAKHSRQRSWNPRSTVLSPSMQIAASLSSIRLPNGPLATRGMKFSGVEWQS